MKKVVLAFLSFLCALRPALAQFDTASVLGTVRDTSGGVIAGATVRLANTETGIVSTKTTDENGNYEFLTVRIGAYNVTAEKQGFAPATVNGVQVNVNTRQRVDLEMKVGQVAQAVEVTAAVPLIETESSQRGQAITHATATELPLNGREYSSLVLLTSGTRQSAIGTGSTLTPREGSFNVNGLRSTFNNYLLDGVDNNGYGTSNQGFSNQVMQPPPDSVAEFQVVTNNMSAEYGRSGGATINVSYASGTNRLHGSAWEFLRNTSLNAVGFFRPLNDIKPPFNRNQFGADVGGPLKKNRAFFFLDYEGFRQIRKIPTFSTIPTLPQRQGILPVDVTNPLTGKNYPAGTQIPAADIQPFARKVLADLPAPTSSAASSNYQILQSFKNFNDKYDAKFDYQISSRMNGFLRLGQRKANIVDQPPIPLPSGGAGNGATRVKNQQLVTGMTYLPTASQIVEARFGVSRTFGGKSPLALGSPNALDSYGIPGLPTDPLISGGLPTQLITGFSDLGRQATNPQWQYPTVFDPKINYSRLIGRHSLKAGYEFQRVNTQVQDVNPLYGRDTYAGQFTRRPAATPDNVYNLADFLFGLRSQYALSNIFIANLIQNMHFLYLQDDFKFSPKLTLNLGVRYEYATPQWEDDNNLTNFDPGTNTLIKAKSGSIYDRALIDPDRGNWAPRLGFAYSLNSKTVVRSGFGISYIHFHRSGAANLLPINGPQVVNAVVNQKLSDPTFLTTQQGYPAGLASPQNFDPIKANITFMQRDTKTSYVTSWFLSIQRELAKNTVLDVAYVGNRANRLLLFANYNQAVPNAPGQSLTLQQRRPIATFGDITFAFNGGFSDYNSLQVRFERRFASGLFLLNSFTWSKAIDDGSGSLENPNGNFPAPQDYYNRRAEKAASAYDQPLTNMTSLVWQVPVGKGRRHGSSFSGVADAILGGWEISGINSMYSGQPITLTYQPSPALIVSGIQQDFRGANNYRPNITGPVLAPNDQRTRLNYFNKNNVAIPDPSGNNPFGNAGRNIVRSNPFYQLDFAAVKNFNLPWETMRLQFRTEVFNLLNKTNFLPANSNRSSPAFGTITQTFDPRLIQFALKLIL